MYRPFEDYFAGFSPNDGTVDFYLRVNTLADPQAVFLDYGAGRAAWFEDDTNSIHVKLRDMRGKFAEVIATDIDPVVMENRSADCRLMMDADHVPVDDASVDVVVADYVIEHIQSPEVFAAEISRILKPGGWFCARTPHKWHYVAMAERVMTNSMQNMLLRRAQPDRKEEDVFEKTYKMNTLRDITAAFPGWSSRSYLRRCDPAYYFGSRGLHTMADWAHRVMPAWFSGNIFVFLNKPYGNI